MTDNINALKYLTNHGAKDNSLFNTHLYYRCKVSGQLQAEVNFFSGTICVV